MPTGIKKSNLAFIDIETTGLDPEKHEILEVGCIIVRQVERAGRGPTLEKVEEFDVKVKPTHLETAEQEALRISKYNDADWTFAVQLEQALKTIADKIRGCVVVGQNIGFDWGFLEKAFSKAGIDPGVHHHKIDVVSVAFTKFYNDQEFQKFGLYTLCKYFEVKNEHAHSALSDIRATLEVYRKLLDV